MAKPLLFLIKLAWEARYRIPLIITIGFMALDIRMQFEINVQMRRIRRARTPPPDNRPNPDENNSDDDSDSWMTIEENEEETGQVNAVA